MASQEQTNHATHTDVIRWQHSQHCFNSQVYLVQVVSEYRKLQFRIRVWAHYLKFENLTFIVHLIPLNTWKDINVRCSAKVHVICDSAFVSYVYEYGADVFICLNAVNVMCASVGILNSVMPCHQCCWSGGCCYHPCDAPSHLQSHAAVPGGTCHWLTHWRCCSTSAATCLSSVLCYLLTDAFFTPRALRS